MEQSDENSIKHKTSKEEVIASFEQYLGEDNLKVLRSITPQERELFKGLLPKILSAYFVKGRRKILKKFKAYFLARCLYKRYEAATFMLKEYIEGITNKVDDDLFIAGAEKELVFLYLHGESSGWGNTDNWIASTTLDKVANRKRKGYKTVILSERDFPLLEVSKELKVINLGGAEKAKKAEEAIQKIKEEYDKSDSPYRN